MKPAYRTGTINDKHSLQQLGLNAYGQFKAVLSDEHWHTMQTFLAAEQFYTDLLEQSTCFVCETNGLLVGMAFLVPNGNPTNIFSSEWSYIRMVGVHTAYENLGIGKTLTTMCVEHARNTAESVVALHTSEFMNSARHLYEKLGFKRVQEIDARFGKRYWLYKLEL